MFQMCKSTEKKHFASLHSLSAQGLIVMCHPNQQLLPQVLSLAHHSVDQVITPHLIHPHCHNMFSFTWYFLGQIMILQYEWHELLKWMLHR
jgi:hypothetical protein